MRTSLPVSGWCVEFALYAVNPHPRGLEVDLVDAQLPAASSAGPVVAL